MEYKMEYLLHYVWQHRIYGRLPLRLTDGREVEVIDPGVHNLHASGPDFFNAKVKLEGIVWAGNVEVHEQASDWYRHHHETDRAYNNVVLHVVGCADTEVRTADGKQLPQLVLDVPAQLEANYRELQNEETYPPCYRVIPQIDALTVHSWMSRLAVERLEAKMQRVEDYLQRTGDDWERVCFVTLARNFGFGTNAQAFEHWAMTIRPSLVESLRESPRVLEAYFMGQAGLLGPERVAEEQRDEYYLRLCEDYEGLQRAHGLLPIDGALWKFGRLRPQNFPYVRLSQLAQLYAHRTVSLFALLEFKQLRDFHAYFTTAASPYWRNHYAFGTESPRSEKKLRAASLNLLVINTAAPLLFAYGRKYLHEAFCERAFGLLEAIPPEHNYITRCWDRAGIAVAHAADSQALIQLRQQYCDRKDCLRCRFGAEYLRRR